jgi:hypothetical protein
MYGPLLAETLLYSACLYKLYLKLREIDAMIKITLPGNV